MKVNEKIFNSLALIVTGGLLYVLVQKGIVEGQSIVSNLTAILFNLVIFLVAAFGLQFFQLSFKRDIQAEIFDQNNVAAAIYQGFLFLALAVVISKGLM